MSNLKPELDRVATDEHLQIAGEGSVPWNGGDGKDLSGRMC